MVSLRFARKTASPAFRLLHVPGAGLDGIDFSTLSPQTEVCNVFEHEGAIAEYVLLAMLDWQIGLQEMRQRFTPESWAEVYRNRASSRRTAGPDARPARLRAHRPCHRGEGAGLRRADHRDGPFCCERRRARG